LHDEQARLRGSDQGQLLQLHGRAVGFDIDVLDQGGRSFPGPDTGELVDHVVDAFFHRHFGFEEDFFGSHKDGQKKAAKAGNRNR
jgi:hypothetical protein